MTTPTHPHLHFIILFSDLCQFYLFIIYFYNKKNPVYLAKYHFYFITRTTSLFKKFTFSLTKKKIFQWNRYSFDIFSLTTRSVFKEIEANDIMQKEAMSLYHLIQKYVILGDISGKNEHFNMAVAASLAWLHVYTDLR